MNIEVKNLTDMFHIEITLEDTFSFATVKRNTTVSGRTLLAMQKQIGDIVINRFNEKAQVREILKLKDIKRQEP